MYWKLKCFYYFEIIIINIFVVRTQQIYCLGCFRCQCVSRGENSNKTVWALKSSQKSEILSQIFGKISQKISNIPNFNFQFSVSRKISQVARFQAKSSECQKNFVFLSKQPFLGLTSLQCVKILPHFISLMIFYNHYSKKWVDAL